MKAICKLNLVKMVFQIIFQETCLIIHAWFFVQKKVSDRLKIYSYYRSFRFPESLEATHRFRYIHILNFNAVAKKLTRLTERKKNIQRRQKAT